ncbi:ATP-dependent nuclease [Flavobacterium hibisci]|uniref:ATP-dependent nuclease n=1 Tax=Flavobacterium hibisci TaxID=1914462 RepID=UPI001CBB2E2B|nr:AAA family ATPase [Flavobacterium hibisci]MBZ4042585.1 AAA family ATPase [Flavobacterium hibisci]
MINLNNPFISRIRIKNFRNFLDVDVELNHKQVIIGENNTGKTNFLRAIQLILDRDYSDNDRQLTESDFHDSIENPMLTGQIIEIVLEIQGYEHNKKLVAQFEDAVISADPPTLQFRYRFFPNLDENGKILNYKYEIYKGKSEAVKFTYEDRNYINIYVIKALRDVEKELRAGKNSTLYQLVKQYEISPEDLYDISEAMQLAADKILDLDEIVHIKNAIQNRFQSLTGLQNDTNVTLQTFEIDTERLLYALQAYMGLKQRPVSELSMGLTNILFVSLMLLLLKDKTVKPIVKSDDFQALLSKDSEDILSNLYTKSEKGNFILNEDIDEKTFEHLYEFMDANNFRHQAFTILAVEEPEAHLHPILQRLIYREVLHKSNTSVIFTSHSTFISSVTPLNSIVHIRKINSASEIFSTKSLKIGRRERHDMERYIDAKRGEIYFGKAIILVEGITEEFIIPVAADILELPLDDYGIVVCNINSTNFKPYIQLLNELCIPWILFTDGDYYEKNITVDTDTHKTKVEKKFHILKTGADEFYKGNENISSILVSIGELTKEEIPEADYIAQNALFCDEGCYIGTYTFEVDLLMNADEAELTIIKSIYGELIKGKKQMLKNFENDIDSKSFWEALQKIDNNIGKGRFAQRLAGSLTKNMIPEYISKGIEDIINAVKDEHE